MTHRLKMRWLGDITLFIGALMMSCPMSGCDPEMTGELIDASIGDPMEGGEEDPGGDMQMGPDAPPPQA